MLWWRRNLVAVAGLAVVAMAAHVLLFGWTVRCGAGLPLAFVLAYLVGVARPVAAGAARPWRSPRCSPLSCCWRDSAAGPALIPVAALLTAGAWGIGHVVRQRVGHGRRAAAAQRGAERSCVTPAPPIDVSSDRARMSAELDALLDERLEPTSRARRRHRPTATRTAPPRCWPTIEADSRRVLEQMRTIVGTLRGGEVALAPAPSVAHLEALLSRRSQSDARLVVAGDPRTLPASVELSAYRVVEHLLGVLDDEPRGPDRRRDELQPGRARDHRDRSGAPAAPTCVRPSPGRANASGCSTARSASR